MTIYEKIYKKIEEFVGSWDFSYLRFEAGEGFMPLVIEKLSEDDNILIISIAHYYKMNGDLVPDPDMEVRVYLEQKVAEALTYQDMYTYQDVYKAGSSMRVKKELNRFLLRWLKNIKAQGYELKTKEA